MRCDVLISVYRFVSVGWSSRIVDHVGAESTSKEVGSKEVVV
jgi:hypothetical protein